MTADPDKEQEAHLESIIDLVACPICGNDAMNEVVHHTHEENIQCHSCGYARRLSIIDGKLDMQEYVNFGCYKVQMKGSPTLECGSFTSPEAEQAFVELINNLGDKVVHAEYSRYINEMIETTTVVDGEIHKIQIDE